MDIQRISVKFFTAESTSVDSKEFINVFHSWIQRKVIDDHLLIDVADYSHVPNGPGVLLIAHEANYCMDQAENRLGLLYQRKQAIAGDFRARLKVIITSTVVACHHLENDPALKGRIKFNGNEFQLICNDRLCISNNTVGYEIIKPKLEDVLREVYGIDEYELTWNRDPKERLTIDVHIPGKFEMANLLDSNKNLKIELNEVIE